MPKLLQRSIYKMTAITIIIGIILGGIIIFELVKQEQLGGVFFGINYMILIISFNNAYSNDLLPDYIFVAPYSYEQRKDLVKKSLQTRYRILCISFAVVVMASFGVGSLIRKELVNPFALVAEILLFCSILHMREYAPYLRSFHMGMLIIFSSLYMFCAIFLSGVEVFSIGMSQFLRDMEVEYVPDAVVLISVILISIVTTVICRVKCHEERLAFMADYESFSQLKRKEKTS